MTCQEGYRRYLATPHQRETHPRKTYQRAEKTLAPIISPTISPGGAPTNMSPSMPSATQNAPLRRFNDLAVKYHRPLPIVRVIDDKRCYTVDHLPRMFAEYECVGKTYGGNYLIVGPSSQGGTPRRSYVMQSSGIEFLTLPLRTIAVHP